MFRNHILQVVELLILALYASRKVHEVNLGHICDRWLGGYGVCLVQWAVTLMLHSGVGMDCEFSRADVLLEDLCKTGSNATPSSRGLHQV